jgi:DNA (cytosine-5)-methyltransferase 1
MRPLLIADLFCGAGGSSTGARKAIESLGRRMVLTCVNHWDRAIETHKRMHPDARHYCQDVASVRPIAVVPEGRLDLLMASPTCTYHSRARGGRPTSDQQRMDPWHVVTWLTELRVDRLIVENVPEFVDWGPIGADGKPLKSKRGQYFGEWIATIERLGYVIEWRILNCADFGDATTRRRFFLMARRKGSVRWPQATHTKDPAHNLLAPLQRWRPARECIDWALKGRSIFGRKHPLAPRTMQRIYAGAVRFNWPEPFLVVLRNNMLARSIDLPIPTISAGGGHVGLVTPVIVGVGGRAGQSAPVSVDQPIGTITAKGDRGIVEPFLIGQHGERRERPVDEPVRTITSIDRQALVEPFILSQASGGAPRAVSDPLPTITTGGRQGEGTALLTPYYGAATSCKSVEEPIETITTKDRFGLIVPVTHAGGPGRVDSVESPVRTITTASRGELAFITASFGERDGQLPRIHDLEMPMPTIPATGSVRLAQAEAGAEQYDIHFRMLHWRELARAMSFSDADSDYEFAGTKTEITKQIGNAVPVRTAAALVAAAFSDLEAT